jgi:endonuclease/exonuclease/phosphatase family metal-dependent hydrolase
MRLRGPALVCMIGLSTVRCEPELASAYPRPWTAPPPAITVNAASGERSVGLRVMIYNVADLPWPVGKDREAALKRIGDELYAMRRAGTAPDVVLLQEAFTKRSDEIGRRAAYAYSVRGPRARDVPDEATSGRNFWRGETAGKLVGSGLVALSDYPIVDVARLPFGRNMCAGYDCLAAKGALLVRVQVPGVPAPVDIVTTHVNSRRSSGVSDARSLVSHRRQFDEIAGFVARNRRPGNAFVLAGDLNVRRAPARYDYAVMRVGHPFVHDWCRRPEAGCDVDMALGDGDRPGLGTQDLQAFDSGSAVRISPVGMSLLFDQPVDGRMLSDHAAHLVVYRLSWPADTLMAGS